MKLLTKNALIYLAVSLLVFALGGMLFYNRLQQIMQEETGELLALKKNQVLQYVHKHQQLPVQDIANETLFFKKVGAQLPEKSIDTVLYSTVEQENLPYRQLRFCFELRGEWYQAQISHSIFERDDLVETIRNAFLLLSGFFIVLLVLVNFLFTRLIWRPFFRTIERIKNYQSQHGGMLHLEKPNTREFRELNRVVEQMTERIHQEVTHLKNFTENAAHELQTPLAVLQSKLENMLQSGNLVEENLNQLHVMLQTVSRLKKMNQALILLTKIENHQYVAKDKIDLLPILNEKLDWLQELALMKKIEVRTAARSCKVIMNEDLASIVMSNLLTNALKFCPEGGQIDIILDEQKLLISNDGDALRSDPKDIFKRFHKDNPDSDSTGLGLALVDSIIKESGFLLFYNYRENRHVFEIYFGDLSNTDLL